VTPTTRAQVRTQLAVILEILAVAAFAAGAVIGFVEGFAENPVVNYPWGLPIADGLIAAGLALHFSSKLLE
jgi:hypothetical protein